ncbi:hypothetical protein TRIP_C21267 [Candidatus Zixiibacteriota bacterium]|nr:hypothetical protein TRIP_C21267 [candidate division Zixibacteria bacterium]
MEFFQQILLKIFQSTWSIVKKQWIGFIAGLLVGAIIFTLFFYPSILKFKNLGRNLGNFEVPKGKTVQISSNELAVTFNSSNYYMKDNDSLLCYPSFNIWVVGTSWDTYNNFNTGRRMLLQSKFHEFVIELNSINIDGKDTIAEFSIYRERIAESGH